MLGILGKCPQNIRQDDFVIVNQPDSPSEPVYIHTCTKMCENTIYCKGNQSVARICATNVAYSVFVTVEYCVVLIFSSIYHQYWYIVQRSHPLSRGCIDGDNRIYRMEVILQGCQCT